MSEREFNPKIIAFIENLEALDAGGRARLKRNAGKSLAEARNIACFYRVLPYEVSQYEEETYFLVATLFPLAEGGGCGNLGASLHQARNKENSKGLDRRVEILLDADEDQLPFRLRQAARFLKSSERRVYWPQLLYDVSYWTHPDRFVQKQWARSYFANLT